MAVCVAFRSLETPETFKTGKRDRLSRSEHCMKRGPPVAHGGQAGNISLADDVSVRSRSQWSHHRQGHALNEGHENRLRASLFSRHAIEDMFSARDKIVPWLVWCGTRTGSYGGIEAPASGSGSGLCRLALQDGKVDEISTIPDQFAPLKQIGNLPDEPCLV